MSMVFPLHISRCRLVFALCLGLSPITLWAAAEWNCVRSRDNKQWVCGAKPAEPEPGGAVPGEGAPRGEPPESGEVQAPASRPPTPQAPEEAPTRAAEPAPGLPRRLGHKRRPARRSAPSAGKRPGANPPQGRPRRFAPGLQCRRCGSSRRRRRAPAGIADPGRGKARSGAGTAPWWGRIPGAWHGRYGKARRRPTGRMPPPSPGATRNGFGAWLAYCPPTPGKMPAPASGKPAR
ncbi:exported protein of unknown function [Candidatus Methylocalor cossyra]|uniref:DUF4124 domain-containing protein n=1 Tax=Candidatus Methylocalor cossyra TaxID=3108543 RepID=A0ABM9NIZ7_9GAMM